MSSIKFAAYLTTVAAAVVAFTASGTAAADSVTINSAVIGTCLHAGEFPVEGGTVMTVFTWAACGSGQENLVITAIVGDGSECPNYSIPNPARNRVLCADDA